MSQNVNVNLVPGNYPKEFHVSQYDVGRQLVANIVDSTGAYSIPSGATVTLVGTKPSGFGFTLSGSVGSGGVVTFSTTATVTAEYGRIPCEIRITSGSTILGTANCMLIVEESPHPEGTTDGDGEQIISEITLLLQRITEQADRADQAAADATAQANRATAQATAAAGSASAAASSESNAAASEATALSAKDDAVAAKTAAQASEQAAAESAAEAEATLSSYAKVGGEYDAMTVGTAKALLGDAISESTEPYTFRQTGGGLEVGTREVVEQIVGGTVAWNQLVKYNVGSSATNGITFTYNSDGTVTVNGTATDTAYTNATVYTEGIQGHVEYVTGCPKGGSYETYCFRDGYRTLFDYGDGLMFKNDDNQGRAIGQIRIGKGYTANNLVFKPQIFDLTQMFGTTIADAILAMETASAGAGVAWFKALFPKAYYPYNSGELMSVKTSAHVTKDADENVIGNYPLSPIDLRGVPKWVDGKLKFDGDVYEADGKLTRKYGIVDLGTLDWAARTSSGNTFFQSDGLRGIIKPPTDNTTAANCIVPNFTVEYWYSTVFGDRIIAVAGANDSYSGRVSCQYTNATTAEEFKAAMSGVYMLYEKATATTETADPYTAIQICDPDGTEEWVDERTVQIPVGNVTKYHANLKEKLEDLPTIPSAPSANGTYTLKATVSGGAVTYQWVNG